MIVVGPSAWGRLEESGVKRATHLTVRPFKPWRLHEPVH